MKVATRQLLEGTEAISCGVQLARAGVIAAYPTPPSSGLVELLSDMCGDGRMQARFVAVESEHSALATCAGASQTGLRAFTATSSHGLAYMHEMLHWSVGARLPIVLANVNRSMGAPWNIFVDQNDSLSQRDTGWLQFYCENNQEVLDTIIQAFKVAEHVMLPAMVCLDAFFLSHTSEPVTVPDQETVDRFLPPFKPPFQLDPGDPRAFGGLAGAESYMELRGRIEQSMRHAEKVAIKADQEYAQLFGRAHPIVETYGKTDGDVEIALVTSGTVTGTARAVVDELSAAGVAIRLVKIRLFRPFPGEALRRAIAGSQKVIVFDRNISFGSGGIMASELRAAMHAAPQARDAGPQGPGPHVQGSGLRPYQPVFSFVGGLGGRDVTPDTLKSVINYTRKRAEPENDTLWVGLKEQ